MPMRRLALVIVVAALVGGCTMIPNYERPAASVPQQWPDGPAYAPESGDQNGRAAGEIGWRDFFVDPQLQQLIASAFENNRDVRIVALQVEKVRAQYRIQRADLFPQIDAEGTYTKQKTSGNFSSGAVSSAGGGIFSYYRAGVGITSFELDLFGRIRSLKEQALQQYLASVGAARSAQIALVAQVAGAYLNYLADQELLGLAQKTLDAQQDALGLIQKRFNAGIASQLDVSQAQTAAQTARADRARFKRAAAQSRNALVELVGAPVPRTELAGETLAGPKFGAAPAAGTSSELLLRRPDIREAEHQLRAANANIGAARAAFFPRITLVGNYGWISAEASGLFDPASEIWSFMPQISIPIFAGGRNKANLDVAEISKKIEVARYQKTIQTAFREVADALAARDTLDGELAARSKLVDAASTSYDLSNKRYKRGIDNYLTVLDSQRTMYQAQQALINVKLQELTNRVTLYKVLGGGWREKSANTGRPAAAPATITRQSTGGLEFFSRLSSYKPVK